MSDPTNPAPIDGPTTGAPDEPVGAPPNRAPAKSTAAAKTPTKKTAAAEPTPTPMPKQSPTDAADSTPVKAAGAPAKQPVAHETAAPASTGPKSDAAGAQATAPKADTEASKAAPSDAPSVPSTEPTPTANGTISSSPNTPNTTSTPNAPGTPDTLDTPNATSNPNTPRTPDTTSTPDAPDATNAPNTPDKPGTPDKPSTQPGNGPKPAGGRGKLAGTPTSDAAPANGGAEAKKAQPQRRPWLTVGAVAAVLVVLVALGYFAGLGPMSRLSTTRAINAPAKLGGLDRITDAKTRNQLGLDATRDQLSRINDGKKATVEAYSDPAGNRILVVVALRGKVDIDKTVKESGASPEQIKKVGHSTCLTTGGNNLTQCYRGSNTLTVIAQNASNKMDVNAVGPIADEAFAAMK